MKINDVPLDCFWGYRIHYLGWWNHEISYPWLIHFLCCSCLHVCKDDSMFISRELWFAMRRNWQADLTCFLILLIVVEGGSGAMIMRRLFVERPVFVGPCQHVLKTFVWKRSTFWKKQGNLWTMAILCYVIFFKDATEGYSPPNQPMLLVTSFVMIMCNLNLKMDSWTRWPRKLHQ